MPNSVGGWRLLDFGPHMDDWKEREKPTIDLAFVVAEWVLSRFDDPYRGVRRERGFDNLWYGVVPGTEFQGSAVVCSYFVDELNRQVRCDSFATLSLPI